MMGAGGLCALSTHTIMAQPTIPIKEEDVVAGAVQRILWRCRVDIMGWALHLKKLLRFAGYSRPVRFTILRRWLYLTSLDSHSVMRLHVL